MNRQILLSLLGLGHQPALPDLPSECEPRGPAPKSALRECGWKSFCRQESRLYAKRFAIGSFALTKHCAPDARCWRGQIQIPVHEVVPLPPFDICGLLL